MPPTVSKLNGEYMFSVILHLGRRTLFTSFSPLTTPSSLQHFRWPSCKSQIFCVYCTYSGCPNQIKEDNMGRACNTWDKRETYINVLTSLSVNGMIILKRILKKVGVSMWTRLIRPETQANGVPSWPYGYIKVSYWQLSKSHYVPHSQHQNCEWTLPKPSAVSFHMPFRTVPRYAFGSPYHHTHTWVGAGTPTQRHSDWRSPATPKYQH
jgi:hypothetical protein